MWFQDLIIIQSIMNQLHHFLSYNAQGISRIRSIFMKQSQLPSLLKTPQHLIQFFRKSKLINPTGQSSTAKYNAAVLIQWVIDDIYQYNTGVFSFEPSCLNIAFFVLKLMELHLIIKIFNTPQAKQMGQKTRQFLQKKLQDGKVKYKDYCNKIRENNCSIISQNCRKSLNSLIQKRATINFQTINSLLQLQISSIFSNIVLNLRRQIRKNWKQRKSQIKEYFQPLKLLEVKLYYISAAVFPPTEPYLRQLANDIFNEQRMSTYSYLIHEERGLQKMFNYFEQAPLQQFEKDMDLISRIINNRSNKSEILPNSTDSIH